jgi:hypothetical protein
MPTPKGSHLSEETKAKMSAVRKGKAHSKEHSENIGKALKGRVITPEWREKIRQAKLGKKTPANIRKKMSDSKVGDKNSFYGKKHKPETCEHLSKDRIARGLSAGKNNSMYKDGSSFLPYCEKFNPEFRRRVRAFFNNTCQRCGHIHQDGEKNLTVHHVNRRKDACCNESVERLFVTVCTPEAGANQCHAFVSHNDEYWETCFAQLIKNKFGGKCYLSKEEYYKSS